MTHQGIKSIVGSPHLPEIQFTMSVGRSEAIGIGACIAASIILIYLIRKSFNDSQRKLIIEVTRATELLMSKFEIFENRLTKSNEKIIAELSDAKMIPQGHDLVSLKEGVSTYPLPSGYVIRVERKLEHRAVAEAVIGRELASNEHVHHIYGPATNDNRPENLCILDKDQHDIFHTYIQREKNLKGKYPTVLAQRRILRDYFGGILLDDALARKQFQFPPLQPRADMFIEEENPVNLN